MKSVKIKTKELLETIRQNRNTHVSDFDEAMQGYRKSAIETLERNLEEARAGGKIRPSISIIEPRSYADQYDTVIRMLEMSDDKVVELSAQEFTQYVEDKWGWKDAFVTSTALYKSA